MDTKIFYALSGTKIREFLAIKKIIMKMNSKKKYRVYAFKEVKAYNVAKAEAQVSAKKVMTCEIEKQKDGTIVTTGGSPNPQELFYMLMLCPMRNKELKAMVDTILEMRPDPELKPVGAFFDPF